jgi:hypothetical protein
VAPAISTRTTSPSDPTGSSCDGKHPGQQRISSFRGADLRLALTLEPLITLTGETP